MSQPTADLVQRVVEITGTACSIAEAKHLLAACDNDVEAAIALFFEGGGGSGVSAHDNNSDIDDIDAYSININALDQALGAANVPVAQVDSDGVRAPIAPIREQLIGPEDDNFYSNAASTASTSTTTSTGRLSTRNTRRVKVCPLRDFAREGALMEEQLQQAARGFGQLENNFERATHSRSRTSNNSMTTVNNVYGSSAERKRKRLEDLYRPPTDIAFAGTFQAARARAEILKKWLLVNVQSDNFDSQLLNRDVWSDKTIRKLIKRHFLLWQIDVDSSEGRRFVAFYHCNKLPYLCVIDPRTGEEMWKNITSKHFNILPELQKFIWQHKDFSVETATATTTASTSSSSNSADNAICVDSDNEEELNKLNKHKNKNRNSDDEDDVLGMSTSSDSKKRRNRILELSEEEQIALAIRNSMRESGSGNANGLDNKSTSSSSSGMTTALDIEDDDDDEYDTTSGIYHPSDSDCIEDKKDKQENDCKNNKNHNSTTTDCKKLASYEQQLGLAKDELTMLKLRLIKADGTDEIVQLRWPSDTNLQVLHAYINEIYPHIAMRGYKLICAFPRKTLEPEYNLRSLKEIGLHPSANLHITFDD